MRRSLAKHAEAIIKEAQARHLTLATVESCTAGSLGLLLADAPGAGNVFHGGFIVYSKINKTAAVGVPPALIEAPQPLAARSPKPWPTAALRAAQLTLPSPSLGWRARGPTRM